MTVNHPSSLVTRKGNIQFPAYIPVTTFGNKYPLDNLVRPYLPRLSQAVMVSHYYAKQQQESFRLPMFVDSGGFVSLFEKAKIKKDRNLGKIILETENGKEEINPFDVLEFQEQVADVAFTLDFPIPPNMEIAEAKLRQKLTIANAYWALDNRRRVDMPLYACVQGWDMESYRNCARELSKANFDGIAIGGLVPRSRDTALVTEIVKIVRQECPDKPLHIFGMGKPSFVKQLFNAGADSVDSSAYVKLAAEGKLWGNKNTLKSISPTQRLHLALCNLAMASGSTLPLSTFAPVFSTMSLKHPS